jgi:hypothetical protein
MYGEEDDVDQLALCKWIRYDGVDDDGLGRWLASQEPNGTFTRFSYALMKDRVLPGEELQQAKRKPGVAVEIDVSDDDSDDGSAEQHDALVTSFGKLLMTFGNCASENLGEDAYHQLREMLRKLPGDFSVSKKRRMENSLNALCEKLEFDAPRLASCKWIRYNGVDEWYASEEPSGTMMRFSDAAIAKRVLPGEMQQAMQTKGYLVMIQPAAAAAPAATTAAPAAATAARKRKGLDGQQGTGGKKARKGKPAETPPVAETTETTEPPAADAPDTEAAPSIDSCHWIRCDANEQWFAAKVQGGPFFPFARAVIAERAASAEMQAANGRWRHAIRIKPKGGFVRRKASALRADGVKFAKGTDCVTRLCVAHAAFNIVRNVIPDANGRGKYAQPYFETLLPGTLRREDDPTFDDLSSKLFQIYKILLPREKGMSLRKLICMREGIFLLALKLSYADGDTDTHFTVYHAPTGTIIDAMADDEKVVVDDSDRVELPEGAGKHAKYNAIAKANEKALAPFYDAFGSETLRKIEVENIYRCELVT